MGPRKTEKARYGFFIVAVACYMLFVLGYVIWSMEHERERLYADIDNRLLLAAKSLKHMLEPDFHDRAVGPQSITLQEEMINRAKINAFGRETDFDYLYTLVENKGKFYFAAPTVTEEEAREQLSWYFYPYEDIPENFEVAYRTGQPVFTSYEDQWGHFRSVAVPETSEGGRRYLACADYDISYVNALLFDNLVQSLVTAALFLFFSLPFTLLYRKLYGTFRRINTELREHRANLETLIDERTQDLVEAKEAAEAADQTKSDFLAQMSHEIRTPLHAIIGSSELLGESELNRNQRELVQLCLSNGEHLTELVNDILDLSKIEAEHLVFYDQPVDLRSLVEDMADSLLVDARHAGLEFRLEVSDEVPALVRTDPLRIRQILYNITSNAVKFTRQGTVTLRVEVPACTGSNCVIRFSIIDTGIGIPKDKLGQIFDDFMQAETGNTRPYTGTGLGLTISRKLAERMGGDITVESEVGKGSTFTVTLPLQLTEDGQSVISTPEASRHEALRILLVDDAKDNRLLMELYLKHTPHRAVSAQNGREALESFMGGGFDLIFMDISMPVMDGYAAISAIRSFETERHLPPVKAYALTGHVLENMETRFSEAGFDGYLTKPVRKSAVLGIINQVAEGNSAAKEEKTDQPSAAPEEPSDGE